MELPTQFVKKSLIGLISAVTLSTAATAIAAECEQSLSTNELAVALNEINNLMGKYSHYGVLRGEGTTRELFAMNQPDVFWKTPSGPEGPEGMENRFLQPGEANPGMVGGQLHMHSMLTPIIEVAADGKTAQGVWDSFGPNISSGDGESSWLWVKYGVDFIKEDGDWKIWHMQVFPMFNTSYYVSITDSAKQRQQGGQGGGQPQGGPPGGQGGEQPQGAPGGGQAQGGPQGGPPGGGREANGPAMGGPGQNWSGPSGGDLWIYDGQTAARGPYVPEPHCTYDPDKSSASYYDYSNYTAD